MIYVMSDIHGNKRRFESILEQIALQAEDTLYILGDIIDRHPDGIELLQRIMDMPNVQMLLGNHEVMMLNALSAPESNEGQDDRSKEMWLWYDNGGQITHYDFQQLTYAERDRILQYTVITLLQDNTDIAFLAAMTAPDSEPPVGSEEDAE